MELSVTAGALESGDRALESGDTSGESPTKPGFTESAVAAGKGGREVEEVDSGSKASMMYKVVQSTAVSRKK